MSEMRNAYCYISIELDGNLASATPLAEISAALERVADEIADFEEDQILDEVIIIRENRKKIGQVDLNVLEQSDE